jgi:hypothetical protein
VITEWRLQQGRDRPERPRSRLGTPQLRLSTE